MTKPTQLTIEHLAAYLPYGVPLRYKGVGSNSHRIELHPLTCKNLHNAMRGEVEAAYVTIILRPLSQLTVPITHNGETFEPLVRLKSEMPYSIEIMLSSVSEINPNDTPYGIVTRCLSWHFDVFGLIEAGLAVAMNPDGSLAQ